MVKHFDHVTIVVRDVEAAKQFFGLLGFKEDKSVVIAGPPFSTYMGVDGIEAEHITLVLANVSPRTEVQLLKYRHPDPLPDPAIGNLTKLGSFFPDRRASPWNWRNGIAAAGSAEPGAAPDRGRMTGLVRHKGIAGDSGR